MSAHQPVNRSQLKPRRFWTTHEIAAIKQLYPKGGLKPCMDALPHRTAKAIYVQARKAGLNAPGQPEFKRRYQPDPHIDRVIEREYAVGGRGVCSRLATLTGRSPSWCQGRALALGLTSPAKKPAPWCAEEDQILRERSGKHMGTIQAALTRAGYKRTKTAIRVRMKRIRVSAEIDRGDTMTAREVGELLGVDGKTVTTWIDAGWLRARRGFDGRSWEVTPKQVRRFVIDHPAHVDLRKVDRYWFIDMMAGG